MKYDIEIIDQIYRKMIVSVDKDSYSKDYEKAVNKFSRYVQIDGFRKGKAPISAVKRLYADRINDYFIDEYADIYFKKGLNETNQVTVYEPKFIDHITTENGDIDFVYEFESDPVGFVCDYNDLTVEFKPFEYSDEMLTDTIEDILYNNSERIQYEENQTLELNHYVSIKNLHTGNIIPDFKLTEVNVKKYFDDDFDINKIIGLKIEGTFIFHSVTHKINSACQAILPELNDETAKILGHDNLEIMKESIKKDIEKQLNDENIKSRNVSVITAFATKNADNIKISQAHLLSIGKNHIKRYMGLNATDEMLDHLQDDVIIRIAEQYLPMIIWTFASAKIAEDNNITVSDEEINEKIDGDLKKQNNEINEFKEKYPNYVDSLKDQMLSEKVVEFVLPFCTFIDPIEEIINEDTATDTVENADFEIINDNTSDNNQED